MTRQTYLRQVELKSDLLRSSWTAVMLLCVLIAAACVWAIIHLQNNRATSFIGRVEAFSPLNRFLRLLSAVLFAGILFLIPYIKFKYQIGQEIKEPVYDPILLLLLYYWICWLLILLAMTALKVALQTSWEGGFASTLVIFGIVFEIMVRYNFVTDYPLSIGWSEGSRYYYASLFFSKQIYGETFPLPTLHPTRYLLQSFPFLFPSLGIFAHRFWQFLLWIVLTVGASIAVTKRVFVKHEYALRWLVTGWLFLFLLRVGVYYYLEVMVILPLLFVNGKKPLRSLIAIILASFWAGISRVNWFPMPAMISIAMYLFENPLNLDAGKPQIKQLVNYFSLPALWGVVGLVSALFSQRAYVYISGNAQNADAFTSSFTSDLLWYRLWPNENFPLGVIPAILILSSPLLAVVIAGLKQSKSLHSIRWTGLILMLLALFVGSAVVSTKIGGGGDLHNMDAYAVFVGILGLYLVGGHVEVEDGQSPLQIRSSFLFGVALILPILILIPSLSPYPTYKENVVKQAHQQLIDVTTEISKQGPLLFVSERQMVSLGEVDIPLVYDYEVVTLMEMAMSRNEAYLDQFYGDLASHRFAAIISGRQNTIIKMEGDFVEENNVWNTYISPYVLCYYESSQTIETDRTRIEVYVPRTQVGDCPSRNLSE